MDIADVIFFSFLHLARSLENRASGKSDFSFSQPSRRRVTLFSFFPFASFQTPRPSLPAALSPLFSPQTRLRRSPLSVSRPPSSVKKKLNKNAPDAAAATRHAHQSVDGARLRSVVVLRLRRPGSPPPQPGLAGRVRTLWADGLLARPRHPRLHSPARGPGEKEIKKNVETKKGGAKKKNSLSFFFLSLDLDLDLRFFSKKKYAGRSSVLLVPLRRPELRGRGKLTSTSFPFCVLNREGRELS